MGEVQRTELMHRLEAFRALFEIEPDRVDRAVAALQRQTYRIRFIAA